MKSHSENLIKTCCQSACKGRELDRTTPEQRAVFAELDPVPVCFLQLVGKRYPLKAVRTFENEKEKRKKKKIIPFEQNLLGSIRPFPKPIQFFVQVYPMGSPGKGAYHPEERL